MWPVGFFMPPAVPVVSPVHASDDGTTIICADDRTSTSTVIVWLAGGSIAKAAGINAANTNITAIVIITELKLISHHMQSAYIIQYINFVVLK